MPSLLILAVGVVLIVWLIVFLRFNAFLALLFAALTVSFLAGIPDSAEGDWSICITRVAEVLGTFVGKVGIIIAMGAIIGNTMMLSGAADRIVLAICRVFGDKRVPVALFSSGFVLSIPVFYDATLFLLIPLARSVYRRIGKNYLLYLTAIGAGATITHVLVPPTPGPLLIAEMLRVPLGTMLLIALMVGILMSPVAIAISYFVNWYLPNPSLIEEEEGYDAEPARQFDDARGIRKLPSLWLSLVPLLLPVFLIAARSITDECLKERVRPDGESIVRHDAGPSPLHAARDEAKAASRPETDGWPAWKRAMDVLGNAQLALLLGAAVSMGILLTRPGMTFVLMQEKVEQALLGAAMIVLITAAGGAFGKMLELANVGGAIAELFRNEEGRLSGSMLIIMSFVIAALIKTAQGSSTTAMSTTAGIVASMGLLKETLDFNVAYLAVAIGCGSIVVGWMNDSGFWAFCRMGRISETDAMKTWTVQLGFMGVTGVLIVLVLSRVFPLL